MSKKKKLRILSVGEFSQIATGFATYYREILTRLHATGKYHVAELAVFGHENEPRALNIPWTYYGNMPNQHDPQYDANPNYGFGLYRFNHVCLNYKTHVAWDVRDAWMYSFIPESPFRPMFKWGLMPTYDSADSDTDWLPAYIDADALFAYSTWAVDQLTRQCGGHEKIYGTASPAYIKKDYKPVRSKEQLRTNFGLLPNLNIALFISRNQRRKLFPDLFASFRLLLNRYKEEGKIDLIKRTYLYCHTSFPDVGWKLDELLGKYGLANKVLFSYICERCSAFFPSFFQGARTVCKNCQNLSAIMPNTQKYLPNEILAQVYNLADVYLQTAICLHPEQEILTACGWKPIKNISTEDFCFTHNGNWKKVLQKFTNNVSYLNEIKICSDYETLKITDNHPVLAINRDCIKIYNGENVRQACGRLLSNDKFDIKYKSIDVVDLKPGDMLLYRIDNTISKIEQIDISKYAKKQDEITESEIKVHGGHSYPRYIKITDNFLKFCGLFAANGSSEKKNATVKVTLNTNRKTDIELCKDVLKTISGKEVSVRIYKDRNALDIICCSRLLRDVLLNWFGKKLNKKLPDWCLYLPFEEQEKIIYGMFFGDGYEYPERYSSIYNTTSKFLADNLKHLLRRLRLNYNTHIVKPQIDKYSSNRKKQYKFEIRGHIKSGGKFETERTNTLNFYHGDYQYLQVKSISQIDYNGEVYNLEVEDDHSFQTRLGLEFQCEGSGMSTIEAAACGIPVMAVDYSAMESNVRELKGTPIKVERMFLESETHAYRAYFDCQDLADKLYKFFALPPAVRAKKGYDAMKACHQRFDYDESARQWMKFFDTVDPDEMNQLWKSPPRLHQPQYNLLENASNSEFLEWAFVNTLGDPSKLNSLYFLRLLTDLNQGIRQHGRGGIFHSEYSLPGQMRAVSGYNRDECLRELANLCEYRNHWERIRVGLDPYPMTDCIRYARNVPKDIP